MSWLKSLSGLVDLTRNREAVAALMQLADTLASVGPILGRADIASLLLDAARNADVAHAAEEALTVELRPAWNALIDSLNTDKAQTLLPLFCRLADLGGPSCSAPRDGLTWPLLELGEAGSKLSGRLVPDALGLVLAGGANSRFELLPQRADGSNAVTALGLRLSGESEAAAGFSLPIRLGRIGARSAAEAGLVVDYRYAAGDDDSAIRVLGRALGQLPSPFDLAALDQALSAGEPRSATLHGAARNAISASISVGESANLVQGTAVEIGLDFTSGRERHSRVQLRVEQDSASTEPALSVALSRRSSVAEMSRIGVGLIVDPSPAVEHFAAGLAERAGEAAAAFKHMEQVFPPTRAINFMDLDGAVRAVDLVQLERAFVDTAGPEALIERLRWKVMQVIDAEQDVWDHDSAILARAIARRAATEVGLGPTDVQRVVDAMEVRLSSALASLHNRLKARLRTVPEIPKRRGVFSIFAAGSRDPQTEALDLLRRGQGLLGSFSSAVERAARSKVMARLGQTMREEQGREVDWRLRLYPSRDGAADFYQSLFTGDLDAVLEAVSELGNTGAVPAELVDGHELVTASIHRKQTRELVLLDVSLFDRSIFDADVAIEVDQAGNIRVLTRGESLRKRGGLGELRVLRAVNVFELAQARDTRRMTFSLSMIHREDDLEDQEIDEFFTDLEKLSLLPAGTSAGAKRVLQDHFGPRDQERPAEMRIWLDLDTEGLLRLLQISDPDGGIDGNRFDHRHVYRTAVSALSSGFAATGSGATQNNVDHLISRSKLGNSVEDVLLKLSDKAFSAANAPHATDSVFGGDANDYAILTGMVDRAEGFVAIIQALREVWFSPVGDRATRWTEDCYLDRQRLIDDKTQAWIAGSLREAGLGAVFSEKLRPFSLAFFQTLAKLSADGGKQPFLSASLWLTDEGGGREVALVSEPTGARA